MASIQVQYLTDELDELNHAWHRLDPWPDSVEGLLRLKRRFMIAPLSNGNIRLMVDMAKRAALPWDAILGAEVVRAYKPSPQVYFDTVEILGLKPAEVCMVAAHNGDLAAATTMWVEDGVRRATGRTRTCATERPACRAGMGFRSNGYERPGYEAGVSYIAIKRKGDHCERAGSGHHLPELP